MPTYNYTCKTCGHNFDLTGTYDFFDFYKVICPKCEGTNVIKNISAPQIIYKGKGFYTNDKKEK